MPSRLHKNTSITQDRGQASLSILPPHFCLSFLLVLQQQTAVLTRKVTQEGRRSHRLCRPQTHQVKKNKSPTWVLSVNHIRTRGPDTPVYAHMPVHTYKYVRTSASRVRPSSKHSTGGTWPRTKHRRGRRSESEGNSLPSTFIGAWLRVNAIGSARPQPHQPNRTRAQGAWYLSSHHRQHY